MEPEFRANPQRLLAVVIFAAAGCSAIATAEPVAPAKIRTITVGPPATVDNQDMLPSPGKPPKYHVLKVRTRSSEEQRDAPGRALSATQDHSTAMSDADRHVVHTVPIKPNSDVTDDPDRHAVRTIRVPSQSAPQLER
jgi:hypothetical protein